MDNRLISNVKIIKSGTIPDTTQLPPGNIAFGKITSDNQYHIYGNVDGQIIELSLNPSGLATKTELSEIVAVAEAAAPIESPNLSNIPTINNIPMMQYVQNTSTNDTYVATIEGMTSYIIGQPILLKATVANTTAASLNINGLGAKSIRRVTVALKTGDIIANSIVLLIYDGTYFQIVSQSGNLTATQLATPLTGLSTATATPITASDTIVTGAGKLQAQISTLEASVSGDSSGLKHLWAFEQSDTLTVPRDMKLKVIAIGQGGTAHNTNGGGGGGGCAIDIREYKAGDIITMTLSSASTKAVCSARGLNVTANVGAAQNGGTATGGNTANYTGGAGGTSSSKLGGNSEGCGGGGWIGNSSVTAGSGGAGGISGGNGGKAGGTTGSYIEGGNGGNGGIFGGNGGNGSKPSKGGSYDTGKTGGTGGNGGNGGIFGGSGGKGGDGSMYGGSNDIGNIGVTGEYGISGNGNISGASPNGECGAGIIFGYTYKALPFGKNFGGGGYIAGLQGLPLVWIEEV